MLVFVFTLIYDREAVFYRKIPIQPGVPGVSVFSERWAFPADSHARAAKPSPLFRR
jgi:hypothetical protein